jgi:multiple sugar transport system permease protein
VATVSAAKRGSNSNLRPLRIIGEVLRWAFLILWGLMTVLPLYWMLIGAFKDRVAVTKMPPVWFPSPIVMDGWVTLFTRGEPFRWIFNSGVMAVTVTATNLIFAAMAGYAFSKLKFPGRDRIFWAFMATMMIPGELTLIPLYLLVTDTLGLGNTYAALVIPNLVSVGSIFLMKQFIQSLPTSLMDAARIDGCSEFRVFWKVVLPLARPGLAVLAIFTFVGQWSSFFWPLLVANDKAHRVLQVGLASFKYENTTDYGAMMAGAVLAAIPIAILFITMQKHFLKGITVGGMKG